MEIKTIKSLLKKYSIRPSKRLGQNFLINKGILEKIIKTSDLSGKDTVLEIGSGAGSLTIELAKKVKKVVAVEKDGKMCEVLKEALKSQNIKNVEIVKEDILKIDVSSFNLKKYKVVANIPYYLTSRLIRKLLESSNHPLEIILMIQKEVAGRICSKPPKMSLLSVSVQFYAKPKIICFVSKRSFWPQPKIDSAIIKIVPLGVKTPEKFNRQFFRIVKAGFSQPRKQLANNLSKKLKMNKADVEAWLLKNGINPRQRAETLDIKGWLKLTKSLKLINDKKLVS